MERKGRIERVEHGSIRGAEAVYHLIERVVEPLGLRSRRIVDLWVLDRLASIEMVTFGWVG